MMRGLGGVTSHLEANAPKEKKSCNAAAFQLILNREFRSANARRIRNIIRFAPPLVTTEYELMAYVAINRKTVLEFEK